jgi:hypothetical protein
MSEDTAVLKMGEVHTGLLPHSCATSPALTGDLLAVALGQRVRRSERPVAYAVSPVKVTGVDCVLPAKNGAKVRAVGTVISRTVITGDHVLQGSSFTEVEGKPSAYRRLWSHYLAYPGRLETLSKASAQSLAQGFLSCAGGSRELLDLGAITTRITDAVSLDPKLDQDVPFKSASTSLRWAVTDSPGPQRLIFSVESDTNRTLSLPAGDVELSSLATLCEDLALHDWLLTTLLALIERSGLGSRARRDVIKLLAPAVDHLLHLWMPAARINQPLTELWESLENRPGFSRQWRANVERVRDQMTLAAVGL